MHPLYVISATSQSLNEVSKAVDPSQITSIEIQQLIDEMLLLASGERTDCEKRVMVGLAAPQIGVNLRVIIVDMGVSEDRRNLGQLQAFINPEIVGHSEEVVLAYEGCFSTGDIYGIVPRFQTISVSAYDRQGHLFEREFTGFRARIFQHEIDHLDGIRFPDRLGKEGILHWVKQEQRLLYRQLWNSWPHRCPYSVWESVKQGTNEAASPE